MNVLSFLSRFLSKHNPLELSCRSWSFVSSVAHCLRHLFVAIPLTTLFAIHASLAQENTTQRFTALHKSVLQSAVRDETLAAYHHLRTGPPKRFFELLGMPTNTFLIQLARAVLRIDILYELDGRSSKTDECTATSIAPNVAITSFHCVPGFGPDEAVRIRLVRNYLSDRQESATYTDDGVVLLGGDRDLDWAILQHTRLDDDVYHRPNFRPPISGETVFLIGHPLGQGKVLSTGGCTIVEVRSDSFIHTCATLKGHSGSLIFSKTDNAVLGIHSREFGSTNLGFRFDKIQEQFVSDDTMSLSGHLLNPPAPVDTSGWALTMEEFENSIRETMQTGDARTLALILPPDIDLRHRIHKKSIVELVVESGSPSLLRSTLGRERFSELELGKLLELAIARYDKYITDDTEAIEVLLESGAIPQPDRDGLLPYCSIEHRHDVYVVLREYGYDPRNC